ncbi:MAG: DegT/DnrJ/EryC1/StrS family aminotransferase [Phycisphaeraceae bacterium]|nr:DegT/DnrJ/EryC1/StrS family aminotransferase [Phycisphaeraceae bacterium]
MENVIDQPLALLGGPRAVTLAASRLEAACHWPIVGEEDERAVIDVMRAGTFSALDVTRRFEAEMARWHGVSHALGTCNGATAAQQAMWAAGLGKGDEIICPSIAYWASALPAFALRATVVFADIDPESLCLDPRDIEHRIGPRTKAIMAVHYRGHPCDMDAILAVARRHRLKVIEDISHAVGAMYKSRKVGALGDVAVMSLAGGKSLAAGEAGMMLTDNRELYERAMAFGAYERTKDELSTDYLVRAAGLPQGGIMGRMNQTCAAMGRAQLKHYPARMAEIHRAMSRFWDMLRHVPGIVPHRPSPSRYPDTTMGGWTEPLAHYVPTELSGLPAARFVEALAAEGIPPCRGVSFPLHLHPLLNETDIYREGRPTRIASATRDVRQPRGSLPVSERIAEQTLGVPGFKHDDPELIAQCAAAIRKVAVQAEHLLQSQIVESSARS